MSILAPIRCPQCNKRYRLPKSFDNRKVICKRCQHEFHVTDRNPTTASQTNVPGSIFDSLDVDRMLQSPSSGLEKRKPRSPSRSPSRPDTKASSEKHDLADRQKQSRTPHPPTSKTVDPDLGLVERELAFSWAKKRPPKKQPAQSRPDNRSSAQRSLGQAPPAPELDEEELAIYAAVTRQNRRKNFLWTLVSLTIALLITGHFARQEYEILQTPLTAAQRIWLTEQGFTLKATRVAQVQPQNEDGATVMVAVGRSFADIDKFATQPRPGHSAHPLQENGASFAVNGDRNRQPRNQRPNPDNRPNADPRHQVTKGPLPLVDYDTNAEPSRTDPAPIGAVHQIAFDGGAVSTFSPRGHCYVAGPRFIKAISTDGQIFDQRTLELPSISATAITATADGRYVLIGGERGSVQSYQLNAKGRLINGWTLRKVHRDKIIALRTSNDSNRLIVYSADGRMTIWSLNDQRIQRNVSDLVPQQRLKSLQLTDSAVIITSAEGIRKVPFDQSKVQIETVEKRYRLLAANKTGERIVFCDDQRIGVFDAVTKRVIWSKEIKIAEEPRVEFSPDGQTAFYFDGGRSVLHFEVSSGRILSRFAAESMQHVRTLAVGWDGSTLLTGDNTNRLHLFPVHGVKKTTPPILSPLPAAPPRGYPPRIVENDPGNGALANANVTNAKVSAVCLTDNGFLVTATRSGHLIVFDWINQRVVSERFEDGQDPVSFITSNHNKIVFGRESGIVEISKIELSGILGAFRSIAGHADRIKHIDWVSDSPHIVSVTDSGHTRVWDVNTGDSIYDGRPVESRVESVVVDRRSDILLVTGNELITLDYKTGNVRKKKGDVRVSNVRLLPDGRRLAFFDRGKLKLATTSRGTVNLAIDLPPGAKSVSFSPDSKFAFLFANGRAITYRLRGGKEIFSLEARAKNESAIMVFSSDDEFMTPFSPNSPGNFKIYPVPRP